MSVQRFKVDSRGLLVEHPQGSLVPHSAYAGLESKLDAVNKWLKSIEDDGHIDEGWDYDCQRLSELRAIVGMHEPPK